MKGWVCLEENESPQSQEGQNLYMAVCSGPLLYQTLVYDFQYLWKADKEDGHCMDLFQDSLLHVSILQCLRQLEQVKQVLLDGASDSGPRAL